LVYRVSDDILGQSEFAKIEKLIEKPKKIFTFQLFLDLRVTNYLNFKYLIFVHNFKQT